MYARCAQGRGVLQGIPAWQPLTISQRCSLRTSLALGPMCLVHESCRSARKRAAGRSCCQAPFRMRLVATSMAFLLFGATRKAASPLAECLYRTPSARGQAARSLPAPCAVPASKPPAAQCTQACMDPPCRVIAPCQPRSAGTVAQLRSIVLESAGRPPSPWRNGAHARRLVPQPALSASAHSGGASPPPQSPLLVWR
eukprot:364741-Chlamydomonas_euryale.AAC.6